MNKYRRKIALAIALILAIGSAAASAANYVNGRSAVPSFDGTGDAMEMALGMAGKSTDWMITSTRKMVKSAFSYSPPSTVRPPEVPYVPHDLPLFQRGAVPHTDLGAMPYGTRSIGDAYRAPAASFEAASSTPGQDFIASIGSPASSGGGEASGITAAVPEVPAWSLLLAGLALMAPIVRSRCKSPDA